MRWLRCATATHANDARRSRVRRCRVCRGASQARWVFRTGEKHRACEALLHLQRLETAGLVIGSLELSEDGKALKYYDVAHFDVHLTAATVAHAAKTLTTPDP